MKPLHIILFALVILIMLITFGTVRFMIMQFPKLTGNIVTQTFTPQEFSDLSIRGPFNVRLTQTGTNEIKITTDEALFPCIQVKEEGSRIFLSHSWNIWNCTFGMRQIMIDVSFEQLKSLRLGGSSVTRLRDEAILHDTLTLEIFGSSEAELRITAPEIKSSISGSSNLVLTGDSDDIRINMNGSSKIKAYLTSTTLLVDISGSSDFVGQGNVTVLQVKASGSSDFDGKDLQVQKATLEANGSSDITVHAQEIVSQKSHGSSDITNVR